mmetsp:Transcript_9812/g.19561  ORF Transcript_9812/g.19561 Transcript_9812/m.19561 type:complete len:159 (-) Transcript_9812:126-602(-)
MMEHLTKKYGAAAVARFSTPGNPLDTAGAKVGITFNKTRRIIRTTDAHRLMEWAKSTPVLKAAANDFMEAMFKAYFEEAKDLSKHEELLDVAEGAGLPRDDASSVLNSDKFADVVQTKDESNKTMGISGVPFFLIGPYKFSGAQPPEVMAEVIEEVLG